MSGGRVLVVDDSLSVRRAIDRMLSPRGFEVALATEGGEALERLAAAPPALIICDVMLPGVDGYEVCRFVRERPALGGVPVLLISGVSSPEVERRAATAGAAAVLAKPFTAEELIARVEGLVNGGSPAAAPSPEPIFEELLAGLDGLPGYREAYLVDAGARTGRAGSGGPASPALLALIRQAAAAAEELGLGGASDLVLEGAQGTLVAERVGRATLAVRFDRSILFGLARHLVRRLCLRAESKISEPMAGGERDGNHPR